ncbi:MAG: hypothetical protein LBL06_01740 [Treponema sp.]|jgi:hypothetical protein|nr:hypothetical protein [Treponema sp.]
MRIIFILLTVLFTLNGCKSAPPPPSPIDVEDIDIPEWVSLPPPDDEIGGIGASFATKDYTAMITAETRAKASIVQRLQRYLDDALRAYNRQADAGNRAVDTLIEDIAFKMDNTSLETAVVNKRTQMPNKTWWYCVYYKKTDARDAVFQILDSEIEEYPEFNPNRVIVFFDEQMKKTDVPLVTSE